MRSVRHVLLSITLLASASACRPVPQSVLVEIRGWFQDEDCVRTRRVVRPGEWWSCYAAEGPLPPYCEEPCDQVPLFLQTDEGFCFEINESVAGGGYPGHDPWLVRDPGEPELAPCDYRIQRPACGVDTGIDVVRNP